MGSMYEIGSMKVVKKYESRWEIWGTRKLICVEMYMRVDTKFLHTSYVYET